MERFENKKRMTILTDQQENGIIIIKGKLILAKIR